MQEAKDVGDASGQVEITVTEDIQSDLITECRKEKGREVCTHPYLSPLKPSPALIPH